MEKFLTFLLTFVIAFLFTAIILIILCYPTMLLWNWLMPIIFGLPKLTFWQTFGFGLLLKLILPSVNVNNKN